jgi:succinate dehydrogenase / fumarate reductase membrane anchor subunit
MVKSVLSVSHLGLRDWAVQRVSAIIMAVYSIWLIAYLVFHPELSFAEWRGLFSSLTVKIASILFLFALLWHAWIGMWTIFTDYVKPYVIRCVLNVLVILALATYFIWGLMILWSV